MGYGHTMGEVWGEQAHTLTTSEIPMHTRKLNGTANTNGISNTPANNQMLFQSTDANVYAGAATLQAVAPSAVSNVGGS
jgi:microcystin-dependent protein